MSNNPPDARQIARAALFHGPERGFELIELPLPVLDIGEALVRVEATTLCGSDLHSVTGRRSVPVPTLLGHEIVGRIERFAGELSDVHCERLHEGDRVVWSVIVACGHCVRCARGMPQKCERLAKFGHSAQPTMGARLDGGLADYVHLPRGARIVRVSEALPAAIAAQASCSAATAAACLRTAARRGSLAGARLLIHGAGALGLFACVLARTAGVGEVHVVDLDENRLDLARALGATSSHALDAAAPDRMPASLDEVTGAGFDVALELSGQASACERSIALAALGGTVVFAGTVLPTPSARFDPERVVRGLVRIEGVHNYLAEDLVRALAVLQSRREPWPAELSDPPSFALEHTAAACEHALRARPLRVLVRP